MQANIGTLDRVLRSIAGSALAAPAATGELGPWAWIGVVPLATGLIGWCPAYSLMGVKTCRTT